MKKIFLMLALVAIGRSGFAQWTPLKNDSVPSSVNQVFIQDQPSVKNANWYRTSDGYRASYITTDGTENYVNYNSTGNKISWGSAIMTGSLPGSSVNYLTTYYPGEFIEKAYKLNQPDKSTYYEIYLSDNKWLRFDANGTIVPVK